MLKNQIFENTRSRLSLGEHAFCIAASQARNSLPSDVKSADTVKTFTGRFLETLNLRLNLALPEIYLNR